MDYDKWLQQPYDDRAKMSASIEKEIEVVLQEEKYNPLHWETFLTAVDEGALNEIPIQKLITALEDPAVGHSAIGTVVYNAVYDWCYKQAENEAAKRYNDRLG